MGVGAEMQPRKHCQMHEHREIKEAIKNKIFWNGVAKEREKSIFVRFYIMSDIKGFK